MPGLSNLARIGPLLKKQLPGGGSTDPAEGGILPGAGGGIPGLAGLGFGGPQVIGSLIRRGLNRKAKKPPTTTTPPPSAGGGTTPAAIDPSIFGTGSRY